MKFNLLLKVLLVFITLAIIPFIWPATDIEFLGKKIDWNGLNLATVTNDRYQGELQFEDSLDLRGGEQYMLEADLSSFAEDKEKQAEIIAEKFQKRLNDYGYFDHRLKWWIESDRLNMELLLPQNTSNAYVIVQLFASRGQIALWTQDATYDPTVEAQIVEGEEQTIDQGLYEGMTMASVQSDDLLYVKSNYGTASGGYGFKLKFKEDAAFPVLMLAQTETYRGTMLTVDGQPIAQRSSAIESPATLDGYEPVVYMKSMIDESFELNDAVVAVYKSGELPLDLSLVSTQSVTPLLGSNFEANFKGALFILFGIISIYVIYKYKWMGIFEVGINIATIIWYVFILKLMEISLTLPALLGILMAIIVLVFSTRFFVEYIAKDLKLSFEKIQSRAQLNTKFGYVLILFSLLSAISPLNQIQQIGSAIGIIMIVNILIMFITIRVFLKFFMNMQQKYENQKA